MHLIVLMEIFWAKILLLEFLCFRFLGMKFLIFMTYIFNGNTRETPGVCHQFYCLKFKRVFRVFPKKNKCHEYQELYKNSYNYSCYKSNFSREIFSELLYPKLLLRFLPLLFATLLNWPSVFFSRKVRLK